MAIPVDPLRQISDDNEIALVKADCAGVLPRGLPFLRSAAGVTNDQRRIEAGFCCFGPHQTLVDFGLQDRKQFDRQGGDLGNAVPLCRDLWWPVSPD